jgi:hypothetical protein
LSGLEVGAYELWSFLSSAFFTYELARFLPILNKPFYGVEGQGWFLAFSGFQHHVKFSFFKGTSLKPVPPIGQFKDVRSLDVRESDKIDERQLATWINQAPPSPAGRRI